MVGLNLDSFVLGSCWRASRDVKEGLDISGVQETVWGRVTNLRDFNIGMAFSSVQFSHSVVSDSLRPHESQHTRPPCPSPTPGVQSDSCPSSP